MENLKELRSRLKKKRKQQLLHVIEVFQKGTKKQKLC